ncbi:MAG: hypothetical protein APF77_24460 [Clostridia bacterium BRH_c25]|nr:MAG: hypothetical protein APF77_24460 [Clostridia bacterium BRH_c25]
MSKKVFIPTYGGGHVKIVIPIIKELLARGYEVVVLGLTSSALALTAEGIKYKGMKDYISLFPEKEEIYEIGIRLLDKNFNQDSGLDRDEILLYLGINILDISIQKGSKKDAMDLFEEKGRGAFFPYYSIKRIVEYEKPDAILVTCGQRTEKAAGVVGEELNIPVVRVIDLLGEDDVLPYKASVCVMNEIVKNNILKNNPHLKGSDIFVTGQPNIELAGDTMKFQTFNSMYNIHKYNKIITFFSQPRNTQREQVINHLIKLFIQKPNYLCLYKLHPNEDIGLYNKYMSIKPQNLVIEKNIDLNSAILFTDIAITFFSTVGLQLIAQDKPLITVNLSKTPYSTDYSKYNCSVEIQDLALLGDTIESLFDYNHDLSKKLKAGRSKMLIPKSAASNIVDVIQIKLLKQTK